MNKPSTEAFLRDLPSLVHLSAEHRCVLARHAREVEFAARQSIFRYGEPADAAYLIRDGHIALEIRSNDGSALTIQTLGANELLGFSWLFPPYQWYFDACALAPSRAVALDATELRAACEADPTLGYALMKCFSLVMHQRMQATRLQLLDLYGPLVR